MEFDKFELGSIADFSSGILLPRITDTVNEIPSRRMIYNPLAESSKYVHGSSELPLITPKQVGISMLQREAYVVKAIPQVDEQILTSNFASVTLDERLDRNYFVWWFNHSLESQRQLQATGQLGRRVVLKDLRELTISVPDLNLQRDIGELSAISHQQAHVLKERARLTEERALQFIRQTMMEEG
ncbi:hypothetical protein FD51_GL003018 [Lacticaseibacillus zeae DSM 20178 = KCTC 3804]|uniref:Restriction endonuclease subunit S n=2 Tax=Lacticaseibacillus zeae TaxID=57037 RepID=A0A5R8LQP6_LACZE|nr:hypothetical protein [Lacticaseibacillus zeae]KRK12259.1 hypothetical protein FD51_GL003018 [Lacticaseibacillus zeae DSM 20178 = KCTC 3804]OLS09585.1 hypothetical protein AUQ39_05865 [Lacticaseibacillus casei]QVI31100.1 hypothetical protein KG087_09165 [Lacticaseibacillus zeae]TLF39503.1 hypothetical protein FEI14_12500 [Lacticaseibacillus zeae]